MKVFTLDSLASEPRMPVTVGGNVMLEFHGKVTQRALEDSGPDVVQIVLNQAQIDFLAGILAAEPNGPTPTPGVARPRST